jgi:AcrR family transcriptional regulator
MLRSFHPTKRLLVETVSKLLEQKSATQISAEEVLEISGISRGSMYHHFVDLDDLVETTQVWGYSKWVDGSIKFMYDFVITAKSKDELLDALRKLTEITQSDERKTARAQRALALATCASNERMARKLAPEIQRLTDAIADVTEEVKNKGLFKPSVDAHALSTFIQAYTLGKIVNDFNPDPVSEGDWIEFVMAIVEGSFIAD